MIYTDKLVYETKSKLIPNTTEPLKIIEYTEINATIDLDGKYNTDSIERVTLAPTRTTC